jgi:hypothetical protein
LYSRKRKHLLRETSVAVICRVGSSCSGVVAGTRAANERDRTEVVGQRVADIRVRVSGRVRRDDAVFLEPLEARYALVVHNGRIEKVDYVFVLTVHGAVAWLVEGREARSVLAELVSPKASVVLVLSNPVRVHVFEEVVAAKGLDEGTDVGAVVRWYKGAVGESIGGVWRRDWVVLAGQIAVLRV